MLYAVLVASCVWMALGADEKGRFVFLQLPLTPQMLASEALGVDRALHGLSWVASYLLLVPPFLLLLYLMGCALQAPGRRAIMRLVHAMRGSAAKQSRSRLQP
ncbi:hypothetical protein [Xanthomonas sp. D-109]|uniref:hypothetical protein n=1 Tax=Xanthomonas sp. D-109 TaxID=2821274 RepID=UPI001FD20DB2|nr:hypothetical protein [Xanthomonas sp. D-109]